MYLTYASSGQPICTILRLSFAKCDKMAIAWLGWLGVEFSAGADMANVKITQSDGTIVEVSELSIEEVRQLIDRSNGNGHHRTAASPRKYMNTRNSPDYAAFKMALSENAKKFFSVLRTNPAGISADHLCEQLGFNTTNQIGGVTGGGVSKLAVRFRIDLKELYSVEKRFDNGERRITYKAGPEIARVL
jgi:hypothetical protein